MKNGLLRLFIIIVIVSMAGTFTSATVAKDDKPIYVSTLGLPFFVTDEARNALESYVMIRIESQQEKDDFLRYLLKFIKQEEINESQFNMLNRVLSVRDYTKERSYILMSPTIKGIKIEQPYYYKHKNNLIFESKIIPKKENYLYIRFYDVTIKKDHFKKRILFDGKLIGFND